MAVYGNILGTLREREGDLGWFHYAEGVAPYDMEQHLTSFIQFLFILFPTKMARYFIRQRYVQCGGRRLLSHAASS